MTLRRLAISGLIIVGPVVITLMAVAFVISQIAGLPFVAAIEPAWLRPPTVLLVFATVVLGVGYLMRTAVGVVLADAVENMINHIPVLRVVYNASHIAVETILTESTDRARPVRVQAWEGLRVTAFYTGKRTQDGRLLCFMPTAPNITTGYVIEVEREDVIFTGERIEHALTRLLSAGFGDRSQEIPESGPLAEGAGPVRVRGVTIGEDRRD